MTLGSPWAVLLVRRRKMSEGSTRNRVREYNNEETVMDRGE